MNTIAIHMTWKWGGAKEITCSEAQTIREIADENGFLDVADRDPLFISRGRILRAEITLYGNGVRDGQTLIAFLPGTARVRRLAGGPLSRFSRFSSILEAETLADIKAFEMARSADRDFANWETERRYPLILAELIDSIEADEAECRSALDSEVTVVRSSAAISEAPLPLLVDQPPMAGAPDSWGLSKL
jgi:hypothetical protein